MSISGGMPCAVERAEQVEATALQVFVKSARQWNAKPLDPSEVETFREQLRSSGLERHTLAHSTYLINLASPDATLWERSVAALGVELDRCETLGVPYLVLHPGSHVGEGEDQGLSRVATGLDRVLHGDGHGGGEVTVLLETTAGQGTNLGHRFEHLAWLLDNCASADRLGVCFDTCHVLAAGYDIRTAKTYGKTIDEFDRLIGVGRLKAFHLNDSKHGLGSRKDRHDHIGKGEVGLEAFGLILNDRRFHGVPMVLETPKGQDLAEDRTNLALLRGLVRGQAK